MVMDVPNAFIQASIPKREKGDRIIMKIRGRLVNWLVEIAPITYRDHVVIKNGVKVLYLEILRAIYGMLEAALLWYRKFWTDLEEIGFKFHDYDPCIAYKMVEGYQHLLRFHVDDILSSHRMKKVNDEFAQWAQRKYGAVKPVEFKRGKVFRFLRMTLDFRKSGECHVLTDDKIEDLVKRWPEEIKISDKPLTPCTSSLFKKGKVDCWVARNV